MSDGQEARYRVTFLGPVHNDIANVNKLAEGLRDRFKLSVEAITKVMKMAPVVIKKGATLSEAQRYKEALEAIGARVQLEPEPIEEARGQLQQTEGKPSPLEREPQIIPVKAKTPPSFLKTAATEEQAGPQMTTCPQCGVVQEATDECIKCGVIISKFLKYQTEVKPAEVEGVTPGAAGTPTEGPQPPRMIGTPMEEPTGSTPWEDMAILGFFTAFFRTMKEVLFSPTAFFRRMPVDKGISNPLFYGVIISFLATIIALLFQFAVTGFIGSFTGEEGMKGMEGVNLFQVTFILLYAFFFPILAAVGLFIVSGILHLCLLIVGGGKRGFETTFRVVAYTCSTQVFSLVPFIGPFIYFFYTLVVYVIGFRESHRTTTGRAFIAVLLPMIIVLFFIGLIVFAIVIPFILSQGQMMQQQQPPSF
ncbi:MAG: hypothetical protein A2Y65_03600 [Deltaproteobacteria bacterium RBG_13_52_11]|nr:MAG: hypothetical protein A2Y65_03600 [Deltaproteobacteria bacterium RBG_13_52_11]